VCFSGCGVGGEFAWLYWIYGVVRLWNQSGLKSWNIFWGGIIFFGYCFGMKMVMFFDWWIFLLGFFGRRGSFGGGFPAHSLVYFLFKEVFYLF
jgi:hypothetical protein